MFAELLSLNLFNFFLVFTRIGGAIAVLPGFGDASVSVRARLVFALVVAFVMLPAVGRLLPPMPESPAALALLLGGEALIGIFIGTIARILISALHTTGTTVAYVSAMANAMIPDPVSQQQGAIVAGALGTIGLVLLFVTDLHHLMLRAAFESYTLFTPGQMPQVGDMSELVSRHVSGAFRLGVQLAAPFLIISFGFYVVLGLISRLMPSFPVFFIGLPAQQLMAFAMLALTLSAIMMVFLSHFDEGMRAFTAP